MSGKQNCGIFQRWKALIFFLNIIPKKPAGFYSLVFFWWRKGRSLVLNFFDGNIFHGPWLFTSSLFTEIVCKVKAKIWCHNLLTFAQIRMDLFPVEVVLTAFRWKTWWLLVYLFHPVTGVSSVMLWNTREERKVTQTRLVHILQSVCDLLASSY